MKLFLIQKQTQKMAFFLVMLYFLHYKKPYNLQICLAEYLSTNELKITNVFVQILGISYLIKLSALIFKKE